jgi:NADPH2:quinone reductase
MQAWRIHRAGEPRDVLTLGEVAPPETPPGMVRVRVAAAGVGLPDVLMCRGSYPLTPPGPFTPGQEVTGEVIEAGEGAAARVGQRVMAVTGFYLGHGSFAAECLAQGDFALEVPDEMEDPEAACFAIPFHTAWVGLVRRARIEPGETLLVLGAAGGTGCAALQLGKALGARVIAVVGDGGRAAFCRELGADVVIDRSATEDLAGAIREATAGRGIDVAWDPVGGAAYDVAAACMAAEGRLLLIGFASGQWGRPSPAHMVGGNYSVVGVIPSFYTLDVRRTAQTQLLDLWRSGSIRVPLHRTFDFADAPEAVAELAAGHVRGKLAIRGPG